MLVPAKSTLGGSGSTTGGRTVWNVVTDGNCVGNDTAFDTTALAAADAIAYAMGIPLYFPVPSVAFKASGTITFQSTCIFDVGAIIHVTSGTITFNGGVTAEITQILDLESGVTASFSKAKTLVGYAEWFGAVTNDISTNCAIAINLAVRALKKVQLMGAVYYTSTVIDLKDSYVVELCGHGTWNAPSASTGYTGIGTTFTASTASTSTAADTVICCTSGSITIISFSDWTPSSGGKEAWGCLLKDIFVCRNITPVKSSGCVGIYYSGSFNTIQNVISSDSMIGYHCKYSYKNNIKRCDAYRATVGSGGGADSWIGFFIDGSYISASIQQGNLELNIENISAGSLPANAVNTSTGIYINKGLQDLYINHAVTLHCDIGCEIVGESYTTAHAGQIDFHFHNAILDYCYSTALKISNTNAAGMLVFTQLFATQKPTSTLPLISITNSTGTISLVGSALWGNGTDPTASSVKIVNSSNVNFSGGSTVECRGEAFTLNGATSCAISHTISNRVQAGKGISLTGSHRNKLEVIMSGTVAGASGYRVLDSTSSYNEFNCTGLDPACITGGSANKLVINGTQVTATGIAAAGHGTNVASGVMA